MGGGPDKEHLLIVVDFPKPEPILDRLKQRFPYVDITYVPVQNGKPDSDVDLQALYKSATILAGLHNFPERPEDVPK